MSGSDFPEGKDWVRDADGRWHPPGRGAPAAEVPAGDTREVSRKRAWVFALALVGVIGFCSIAVSEDMDREPVSEEADNRPDSEELKHGAQDVCHQFVEERLHAPATAGFERFDEATIAVSGGVYTVRGHVDSQNRFGALVRSNYTCVVRHTGGNQFNLVSLSGLN